MKPKNRFKTLAFTGSFLFILVVYATSRVGAFDQAASTRPDTPTLTQRGDPPAPEPFTLTGDKGKYPLGMHLEILEDPGGELTIEEVSSPKLDTQFSPSEEEAPNYGFTNSVYWVRLSLDNETFHTVEWLLKVNFSNMHYVDLYTPLPDGERFTVKQTGVLRPVSSRDILYPNIVFDLSIPIQSQQTYYLRFQNGASMTLGLTLWTRDAFWIQAQQELALHWLFYGILIGLFIYNLFLLFSLREMNYLYFVFELAATIFFVLSYDGYLEVYFLPNLYFLVQYYFPLFFSLLLVSIVLFSDHFLEIKRQLPKLHRANTAIVGAWGVLMLLTPFASYHLMTALMLPLALFSLLVVLFAGIASWRRKFRPSRFFLVAWTGLLVTLSIAMLVRMGFIPVTLLNENLFRLGMIWLALCWSFALADRINLLKAETDSANRSLQNSEHRLSQILEGLPFGVVLYGKDQKPKYINRRTVDILSNPAQNKYPDPSFRRTLAQAISFFSLKVAGGQQEYPIETFPVFKALRGEPASADDIEMDRGNERIPLEAWASPILDEAGNIESAVLTLQDITQRKQAEAELDEYRKELESLVEKRTAEISAINDWLNELNEVRQTISGVKDLPQAYKKLSAAILQSLDARTVFILPWGDQVEQYEVNCHSQPEGLNVDKLIERLKTSFQPDSPLRQDIEFGKTILRSADQADPLLSPFVECFEQDSHPSFVFAPMISRQNVIGVLGVVLSEPIQEITGQQVTLVEKMAFDLTALAQNALVLDQALVLVTAEERNRLARDLHDSVTQVLFSASLLAELLPQRLRRDPEAGLQIAADLRRLTRGALAEMRTLLLELRPAGITKLPLGELLSQLTEAITSRSELTFHLFIDNLPPLPADVQIAFYRIAQEALNNVVKHAQASEVILSLSATPQFGSHTLDEWRGEIKMVVKDDGIGYPSEGEYSGHMGLGIMRERASAINAIINLESQPGQGTGVTLIWRG